jgi:hypothetical protein
MAAVMLLLFTQHLAMHMPSSADSQMLHYHLHIDVWWHVLE